MVIQPSNQSPCKGREFLWTIANTVPKRKWVPGAVIIGAGPSGLAVAACLRNQGVPFLVLEKERCIGSLWRFRTYSSLRLHLPKKFCELPYMQFPSDFPAYPDKLQFIAYLESYATQFSIQPLFMQEVKSASFDETSSLWRIETQECEFMCRWLVIATGENAVPVIPSTSEYCGRVLHTSKYKDGADFCGDKVLVVGCGNSGMEVGLDLSKKGALVSIVVRDKLHILPREVLGTSTFGISMWLLRWLSVKQVDRLLLLYSRVVLGLTHELGIRRPEVGPLELKDLSGKTPVLDTGTFSKIKSGQIKVVGGIRKFTGTGVEFVDGKAEDFDAIILATGYRSTVCSWLKDDSFFDIDNGYPQKPFPNNWKGKNGLYSVGFSKKGLLGTSIDAKKVAQDIASQWANESLNVAYSEF